MKISVRAYGLLQEAIGDSKWITMEIERGLSITDLLLHFGLDRNSVMTVVKNGNICKWDYVIQENDKLEILPFISEG